MAGGTIAEALLQRLSRRGRSVPSGQAGRPPSYTELANAVAGLRSDHWMRRRSGPCDVAKLHVIMLRFGFNFTSVLKNRGAQTLIKNR